jgi:hypothetical protein
MKRAFVHALSIAVLASVLPLTGCDSGGDSGVPADQTPGIPLNSVKTDMKLPSQVIKEQKSAKGAEKPAEK